MGGHNTDLVERLLFAIRLDASSTQVLRLATDDSWPQPVRHVSQYLETGSDKRYAVYRSLID
jgi:hypothetical protein